MNEQDYERLTRRAKHYFINKGGGAEESEDFAQNCAIKAFELGFAPNLEFMYLNHRDHERADKRILSGPQGSITGFRTVSLATPLDSSNENSACLGDLIGDQRDELGSREECNDIRGTIEMIFDLIRNERTREWAMKHYSDWLGENAF